MRGRPTNTAKSEFHPEPTADDLAAVPELWRSAPRRWGHPLHSLCSYFAMFPPRLARVMIEWLTEPGDAVYDPFSGRGTVALEAALLSRASFASDANPMATILSQAKSVIPSSSSLYKRLNSLEESYISRIREMPTEEEVPRQIQMLFSDRTLSQLCFLREELDRRSDVDAFLIATILGILHANHNRDGSSRGLSISMPNTFAMAPGYVERFIKEHHLLKPNVDVFERTRLRLKKLDLPAKKMSRGRSWQQDAEDDPPSWLKKNSVKLVLTSPPYLQVIKYGKYNWVRLWFLKETPQEVDGRLMASASLRKYLTFMSNVCLQLDKVLAPNGYVCFVIGDVRRGNAENEENLNLAQAVWETAAKPLGWHLHATIVDDLPVAQKVSRIWKNNSGRATKTDRLLLMSRNAVALPPLCPPNWDHVSLIPEGVNA